MQEKALLEVLDEALSIAKRAGIDYGLVGGVAAEAYTWPKLPEDIDIFTTEEQAHKLWSQLRRAGFETAVENSRWLLKATKGEVTVDIIFRLMGGLHFDEEASSRVREVHFRGRKVRAAAPEDLIVSLALSHDEPTSSYWFGALGVLSHNEPDWGYLLRRARFGMRRMLSFLIYADSADLPVPREVIRSLVEAAYPAGDGQAR